MNAKFKATTQFNNDGDVFAYRSEAARLRSETVKAAIKAFFKRSGEQDAQTANCRAA